MNNTISQSIAYTRLINLMINIESELLDLYDDDDMHYQDQYNDLFIKHFASKGITYQLVTSFEELLQLKKENNIFIASPETPISDCGGSYNYVIDESIDEEELEYFEMMLKDTPILIHLY